MKKLLVFTISTLLTSWGFAQTTDSSGLHEWRDKAILKISAISSPATRDEIWSISPYIRVAERGADNMAPEHLEVVSAAKAAILQTENHAAIFSQILEESKAVWKTTGADHDFDKIRSQVFKTLSQLPSPQVVELLGSMLTDTEWPIHPLKHGDSSVAPSNARLSVYALQNLLDDPPATHGKGSMAHLIIAEFPVWQLWFDHVKAGSRTFRFKGDPKPYNLKGVAPVERASTPLQSKTPQAPELEKVEAKLAPSRSWIPLALSIIALLVAGGWLLKSRRTA